MTYEEYETKMEELSKKKKGYDGNRTLCTGVIILLGFYAFKDDGLKNNPWYILAILGVLCVCALGILVWDSIQIKNINEQIKQLEKTIPESENTISESENAPEKNSTEGK